MGFWSRVFGREQAPTLEDFAKRLVRRMREAGFDEPLTFDLGHERILVGDAAHNWIGLSNARTRSIARHLRPPSARTVSRSDEELTDGIAFVAQPKITGGDFGVLGQAPFGRVKEVLGDRLEMTDDWPPRFKVDFFPTTSELTAMKLVTRGTE